MADLPIKVVIFHSYDSLPGGKLREVASFLKFEGKRPNGNDSTKGDYSQPLIGADGG